MKAIMGFANRLLINRSAIFKLACKYVGIAFTAWGLISLFVSLSDYIPKDSSFLYKVLIGSLLLAVAFIGATIVAAITILCSNNVCIGESSTKNCVYVQYGDMYSPDVVEKGYNDKRAVVVSVNRCFDNIVDDELISHKTQHGSVFKKLYDAQIYNTDSLAESINRSLVCNTSYTTLSQAEKRKGNLRRYEVGTTVKLRVDDNLTYYLFGLSFFDEYLNANTSKADFAMAVQKLIEFCNQNSQGYPVVLPLIGSGLSRTQLEQKNILHYLVEAFAINKDIINNDFHIVIWKGDKNSISIKDLRKW